MSPPIFGNTDIRCGLSEETLEPAAMRETTARTGSPKFQVSLARTPADVAAAQRLRYDVFVTELGADGPTVDHAARRESDRLDGHADHLILEDLARPEGDRVIGVYRLLPAERAAAAGGFCASAEYDLTALTSSRRRLLELGRSCLHPTYRNGAGMLHLWSALADYVEDNGIDILFGTASFHGTDTTRLAAPLSILHQRHLAPPALRPVARHPGATPMNLIPQDAIDRPSAMLQIPALIKGYLRMGATVGQGAWIDPAFNTTDVCVVLDARRVAAGRPALHWRRRV